MKRVLLLATTTGYQTRMFGEAAERLGVKLLFATDRCDQLEDPWWDGAIPVRFHESGTTADAIVSSAAVAPIDGILAVGDRPTVAAAYAAERLGLPGNTPDAARAARDKRLTRERLRAAGLPTPWVIAASRFESPRDFEITSWPVVVKPLVLSGSRGVMRADTPEELFTAFERLRRMLDAPDVRAMRDPASDEILIEGFIPGREYAFEGVLEAGRLRTLALFDKPDPLDGPLFEETIYVTPSRADQAVQRAIGHAIGGATAALGLTHGPVHAECRVDDAGIYVLEVAARPIGGLCARALSFTDQKGASAGLEELLLRHAIGEPLVEWRLAPGASGVMMVPIPAAGVFRGVQGLERATATPNVWDVQITMKPDQQLVPLPEGASYLGFIFAKAETPEAVERALRDAHRELTFVIDRALPIVAG
jgi:biotin carboxylase